LESTTFDVEKGPVGIQIAPDNRTVVVANELSNSLSIAQAG
jgi:DNA-binding beta-propeller fold protein YncE